MQVKEENKDKFIAALFSLVQAIKKESDNCGKICGGLMKKSWLLCIW